MYGGDEEGTKVDVVWKREKEKLMQDMEGCERGFECFYHINLFDCKGNKR